MTDTFALGKKENIDFNKLKSGITKKELGIENNTILSNIFDSIDKGDENAEGKGNGRLERKELITFINKIKELAGKDRKLSKKEAKKYEIDGNKLGKDKEQLLEFLKKLSELTKGVQSVDENEVVLYEDGHAVQILANGNKKTTSSDKNRITTTDENDEVVEETVVDEDKKTTTNFKNNKKIKSVTENTDNGEKETIIYNEDGKTPKSKVTDFEGTTTTFIYDSAKNKYKPLSEDIKIGDRVKHTEYDSENSDENERQVKQSTVTRNGQLVAKTKNGHSVEYDGQGNTYIIVQPDERDAGKIAKKFGCNKEKLVEINNGKYCFEPGERIKIPQQLEPNEEVLKDRLSSADSKAQYKEECRQKEEAERARQQRAAVARTNATRATKQTTSVRSTAKVNDWQGQKGKDWKYAAIVWDKGATPESMARNLFKREGINNPSASAVSARAKAIYSAFKDIFDKNRKVAKSKLLYYRVSTKAGIVATGTNGYYVKKDANGELVYFDKWNRQISASEFKKVCPSIYESVTQTKRGASIRVHNKYDTTTIRKQAKELARKIHAQIDGASLNENTINLLRGITAENAAFVISEYQSMYKVSLAKDIDDEWGLDLNTVKEHICKKLVDQAKSLGIKNLYYGDYAKLNDIASLQKWINTVSSKIMGAMGQAKTSYYATNAEEAQIQQSKSKETVAKNSAGQIVNNLIQETSGINDVDKIKQLIARIDTPEELKEVNRLLTLKGYPPTDKYSAIENYIYQEANNSIVHTYNSSDYLEQTVQKWIQNGTLKGQAANEAQARMAARVLYDGGDGFGTNCEKIKKAVRLIKCPKPTGNRQADNKQAREVYRLVNNLIKKHNTFYGLGSPCKNLVDYCEGEMWTSEVKYLKGILAETNAIQGKEKAQAIKDLTQEAVEGAGTDIEYLEQAIKGIDSPEDRRAVEAKLKQYCQKKGIKPQIQGQSYLQAILYDECDIMGISRDHKEIRKFNEMLISQGAYTKEEIVNLRAEQAALQILEGNFINAQDAVQQIKDPKVYAKALQLIQNKCGKNLDNFLLSKLGQQKTDLVEAELAANSLIGGDKAVNIAYRLIQSSDFNVRAKGLMAIRNGDVARKVDNMLKAHGSSLAKVMEQFNKEKAEYKDKAALWDGIAMFGGGLIAEHISDRYRDNTNVSDNMYVEATNAIPLTQKQKDAYNQAVKTFEECLNKMKSDYQQALDSQGVVSGAINAFCSVYNLGTTKDEIEARIEHDTETLRLLKLAAKGKLTKYVNGREIIVSFEDVWKERQSDRVTANAVTLTNAIESVKGKKEVAFDVKKVEKVENKAQTLAAMDYAKDNIVVCWDELSSARTERQYAVAIMDTLEKLSNMSGKRMSLSYVGCSLKNGIIVDKTGKPVPTAKLQELANQLKKGLSEVSNSLFGTSLSQDSSSNKVSSVLEKAYDKKVENFKQEYRDAFGQECPDEIIENYTTTISRGLMVANVGVMIGAVIAAPFTGGGSLSMFAVGAGASLAMNGLEHATDADGWTNSEWTTDLSQAAWDGVLTACGYKVGQIAESFAKGASLLSGQNKWIATMLNKMPKSQATKALAKAEEIANKVQTYAGKVGKNVLQTKKANLLKKYPTMNPKTAENVAVIVARVEAAGIEIASDTLQSLVQMYCMEGEFNVESFTTALYMSIGANTVGHVVAARSAKKEVKANSTTPQEYPSAHAAKRGGRDAIADGEVARNADQSHLNANERKIVEDGIDDVPTKEEVDAYQHENGYKKPTAEEKAAIDKNNAEADAANREAHKVENNIDNSSADALKRAKESASDVDFNKNGVFKNENADFVVQNGKVTEIRTKDGRVITDELKIAKYLDKNGIELKDLTPEKVAEPKVETEESKATADEAKVEAEESKVKTEGSKIDDSEIEIEESKTATDEVKVEAEESKVKTDEPKVEAEESRVDVDEPEIKTGHQQNTAKSYSEMNEDELFATYYQLRNEVKYSPLSNADKAAKINELKKIEAELDNKGFRIEGDELVSNKNKANEAKSNDNVKSEDIDMSVEPDLTTESVRQKYGKKIARMYNAVTNSIEKMKTIADFEKIKNYITNKFSGYQDILTKLQSKLITKAKSIGLSVKESISDIYQNVKIKRSNPLDKYKGSRKGTDMSKTHGEWMRNRKDLFGKNMQDFNCWREFSPEDRHHGAWKMHLYSVNEADWREMCDVIIPYLRERGVEWKTFNSAYGADYLNGGRQQGKAFTVYPKNNEDMAQIAKDLDYIIRNNKLETNGSHIIGDNQMGSTGRLFYRYEFNSGAYKDEILDLSNDVDKAKYRRQYDANRGEGRYLANDMSIEDDIWRNFDPSDANAQPAPSSSSVKTQRLQKGQPFEVQGDAKLILANEVEIDLNGLNIKSEIDNLPEGGRLTIGRDGDIKIRDDFEHVSRKHVIIEKRNGKIYVIDNSSNGTVITQTTKSAKSTTSNARKGNNADPVKERAYRRFNKNATPEKMPDNGFLNRNSQYVINPNDMPSLRLIDGTMVDLNSSEIRNAVLNLKDGEYLTLGRNGDFKISNSSNVSRHHIIIAKENGQIQLKDVSSYGCTRAFNQAEREVRDNVIRKFNKNSPTIELTANATMNPNMNYILDFNNLPKLRLNDGTTIDLNEAKYYNAIQHLKTGGFITLGRTGFADIGISQSKTISRHHIILTIQDGELIMKDVSMNGGTSNVGDKYGFYSRSRNRTENSDESYNRDNSYRSRESNSSKISQEQVKEYKNLLEIDENIALTKDAIKKAYRKKSLEWHPDRHPDNIEEATEMMKKINEAKEELDKLVA